MGQTAVSPCPRVALSPHLPEGEPMTTYLLIALFALAAGATVAATARQVSLAPRTGRALAAYHEPETPARPAPDINSALGLVKPAYSKYVYAAVVLGTLLVLLVLGMPAGAGAGRRGAELHPGGRVPQGPDAQGAAGHRAGAADLRQPAGRHVAGHQLAPPGRRGDGQHPDRGQAAAHLDGAAARRLVGRRASRSWRRPTWRPTRSRRCWA